MQCCRYHDTRQYLPTILPKAAMPPLPCLHLAYLYFIALKSLSMCSAELAH